MRNDVEVLWRVESNVRVDESKIVIVLRDVPPLRLVEYSVLVLLQQSEKQVFCTQQLGCLYMRFCDAYLQQLSDLLSRRLDVQKQFDKALQEEEHLLFFARLQCMIALRRLVWVLRVHFLLV